MITQAVVEKIALPIDSVFSSDEFFPVPDGYCHSRLTRERHDRVQMIRHEHAEATVSDESLVIELRRIEHGIPGAFAAQLIFAWRHAVNGNEEPTPVRHPLWNSMGKFRPDLQTHPRSVVKRSRNDKTKR